ncbi:unnamed protein product, partial [Mycena citricolor]
MDLGFWAVGTLHSTATLSIQSGPAVCMGFGSCTVSIFSCSATATRLGGPLFLLRQDDETTHFPEVDKISERNKEMSSCGTVDF